MSEGRGCAVCALWVAVAACAGLATAAVQAQTSATMASATMDREAAAQEQFICRLPGASDRLVGIYRSPIGSQRCRVDYTRDGRTRSLWSAGHDYEYCVRKALKIVGLLEQVSFKCSPQTREAPAPTG